MDAAALAGPSAAGREKRWSGITMAVLSRDAVSLRRAIAEGFPINGQDAAGDTALHFAAWGGHDGLVSILLEAGADPNLLNHKGHSPLFHACCRREAALMGALLGAGGILGPSGCGRSPPLMALVCPPPRGLPLRHRGPLSDAILDLVAVHAPISTWPVPFMRAWRLLSEEDGEGEAARVWSRLEAGALAATIPVQGHRSAPAAPRL